ncbi:hypothetical protein [uncultured Sphingomonas sp.]|uniref:hypothetical protein n=1 Tax=uncultured Sphingomonas sp. TaxID=158754 RepID=UPI0025FC7E64|nr:hypothetical protein [uncultured Sphingomonas sp.]
MIPVLVLLIYGIAVGGVVALLRRFRASWSRRRAVLVAILPSPSAVVVAAAIGIATLGRAAPGDIDATGMATAFYMVGGALLACILLVLGSIAAWIAMRLGATTEPREERVMPSPAFDALLAPLPDDVQTELRRRLTPPFPATAQELLRAIHGWLVDAGIAEGRGGYPGEPAGPGWRAYAAQQRRSIAAFRAVADAWGDPPADLAEAVGRYDDAFPPPVRLQGDGWEPHVEVVAGRHIYAFPVASGHATHSFDFPITAADVDVLLTDPYRRAVLEVVTHTVFQRSSIRGNPATTRTGFDAIVATVLHGTKAALATYLTAFDREHNIRAETYIRQTMERHAAVAKEGRPA